MRRNNYFYVKVKLPWGTTTHYQLSKELQIGMHQYQSQHLKDYYKILKGALINVPIFEMEFQHHYHSFTIPVKVKSVFIRNERCEWRTRGQFISKENLDFNDEKQLKFLQHDYSKFNKWIIKKCWKYWKLNKRG